MNVKCPKCGATIELDPTDVGDEGLLVRCEECDNVLRIKLKKSERGAPDAAADDVPAAAPTRPPARAPDPDRPIKVLVADDTVFFRSMLSDLLKEAGYDVIVAKDGLEAFQMVQAELPDLDLLILDLQLPKMTGFDVLRELRKDESTSSLPVLVMTGVHKKADEVMMVRKLGATGYVSKSNPPEHFLFRVQQILAPQTP